MRERRSLERRQLPESVYETWLHAQTSTREVRKHRSPAEDLYESWVKKRVEAGPEKPHPGRPSLQRVKRRSRPRVDWAQWN